MISKSTHTYAVSASGELQLDVYLPADKNSINDKQPALLYFHGGGLVAFNREYIPPHIVQSCIRRNWPLISVDYDLLPQADGISLLSNIQNSHAYIRKNLFSIIYGEQGGNRVWDNFVVAGNSAGAYMAYQAGHYLSPKPMALLTYYGPGNTLSTFYNSGHIYGSAPLLRSAMAHFLNEPISSGQSPPSLIFYPESLLDDGSTNPQFVRPQSDNESGTERAVLYWWLVQENALPLLTVNMDKEFSSASWKAYPPTVIIHGTNDDTVPYQLSLDMVNAIGTDKATLFTVPDGIHSFDEGLYLDDHALAIVEQAWQALDEIVAQHVEG